MRTRRRSLALWAVALSAVATLYAASCPSTGGEKMEVMRRSMPPELVTAMGCDRISTADGCVSSTVYSLLGAVLALVRAIGLGTRLIAGNEEDGTLQLELSARVPRRQLYLGRLAVLSASVLVLVVALSTVLGVLSVLLGRDLSPLNLIAAGSGLLAALGGAVVFTGRDLMV